jgi:N-acetylmuramoyl-L-alanine amidase
LRITAHPSPNFGPRRLEVLPDIVVIHYTAMQSAQAAAQRLCDPECEVSSHYLIARDGGVFQHVEEEMRAWHAGAGAWGAVTDVNSRSIGIELDNTGARPFPEPQMSALGALLQGIMARWAIRPERVIAHSDLAPTRKFDPGARFDWRRLALQGLSIWPDKSERGDFACFRTAATTFGLSGEASDADLLRAFRLRFRPFAQGPLEAEDLRMISNLARRFPVDQPPLSA